MIFNYTRESENPHPAKRLAACSREGTVNKHIVGHNTTCAHQNNVSKMYGGPSPQSKCHNNGSYNNCYTRSYIHYDIGANRVTNEMQRPIMTQRVTAGVSRKGMHCGKNQNIRIHKAPFGFFSIQLYLAADMRQKESPSREAVHGQGNQ